MDITLTKTQQQVYDNWSTDKEAILEAITGTGKTIISISIIKNNNYCTLVIVNTIALKNQWEAIIEKHNLKSRVDISTIHSVKKLQDNEYDLVILDECHHYFSPVFFQNLNLYVKHKYLLGLTASLARPDGKHNALGVRVIKYTDYDTAIAENLISEYTVINIPISLTHEEQIRLNEINKYIDNNFPYFSNNIKYVQNIARRNKIAAELMRCFALRKNILNNAENKLYKITDIIDLNKNSKVIIFTEFIDFADKLCLLLLSLDFKVTIYHTKIKDRKQKLQDFRDDKFNILIAVKSLDEGIDIPQVDIGIIAASSSQRRQTIQRIGRIIRYKENKQAKIYNLYVEGSKEEQWLKQRTRGIK